MADTPPSRRAETAHIKFNAITEKLRLGSVPDMLAAAPFIEKLYLALGLDK